MDRNNGLRNDEVRGVVIGCSVAFAVFVLWAIALLVLKCRRVQGVLGGNPPKTLNTASPPTLVFGVCSVLYIALALVAIVKGFPILEVTAREAVVKAQLCIRVMEQAGDRIETGIVNRAHGYENRTEQASGLLSVALDTANANNGTETEQDAGFFKDMENTRDQLANFVVVTVSALQIAVEEVHQYCTEQHNLVSKFTDVLPYQVGLGIPMTVIPLLQLICLFYQHGNKNKATQGILLPLFGICTLITTLGCTLFWAGFVYYADFCTGAPEPPPGLNVRAAEYAAQGCLVPERGDNQPLRVLQQYQSQVGDTTQDVSNLLDDLNTARIQRLTRLLGIDLSAIWSTLVHIQTMLRELLGTVNAIIDTLFCGAVLEEIYSRVEDTFLCTNAMEGILWTCVPFLIMTVCGFLMFTFRSALYEPVDDNNAKSVVDMMQSQEEVDGEDDKVEPKQNQGMEMPVPTVIEGKGGDGGQVVEVATMESAEG